MRKNKLALGYILVIASAIVYGLTPLITTIIKGAGVHPFSIVFFRNLLSIPMLAIAAKASGGKLKIDPRALPSITWIALFGCCFTPLLLYTSYPLIGTGMATVFHFVYPAVVLILSLVFLKSKFKFANIASLVICIAGIVIMFAFSSGDTQIDATGSILAILSGLTYAIYIVGLAGFKYKELSGFTFTFYGSIFCTVVSFVICICSGNLTWPDSLGTWGLCIAFAFVCNLMAVILFQKGTQIIGGERASILSALEPITGVIVGIAFLDEDGGWFTVVGTLLVVASSILIAVFDMKSSKKA